MNFKYYILGLITFVVLTSCKKEIYGCTDANSINYSVVATKDDGSCFEIEPNVNTTNITISNWTENFNEWSTIIPVAAITSDVLENGSVVTYKENGNNVWNSLPLTYYTTSSYSTTFEVAITVGQVIVNVSNSDGNLPTNPGEVVFKISVIK